MINKPNFITNKDLEMLLKSKNQYNYRSFIILNSHNIEKYVSQQIKKQLGKKCNIISKTHKPNGNHIPYDLILLYDNRKFTIEVKSGKRFIPLKNGKFRTGYYKIGLKLFTNKPNIIAFCHYYKQYRYLYFVLGKYFIDVFKKRKFQNKTYFTITINQMFNKCQPKEKIKDILKWCYYD